MSQTIKFANGSEFPLAAAPVFGGGQVSLSILISGTATAESVNTVASSYANTKTFQVGTDGTYGSTYSYYVLNGNVSINSTTGYITVVLAQKDSDKIKLEDAITKQAKTTSALNFLQMWAEKKIGG